MTLLLLRRLAIALAILAGAWACASGIPQAAPPTAGTSVVAFGDSLVAGRGASEGHDFVSVLSSRLGVSIVNLGRSGDTTAAALTRLDNVVALDPRIVIVVLGGNDYLRRVPVDETFRNLTTIVEELRRQGAAVLLAGLSVGLMSDPYSEQYESVARQASAGLVPDLLGDIFGRSHLMSDAIHPNDRGYAMIADRLEPVLRELIADDP